MDNKLTAIISTIRHGEKDDKGNLTLKGYELSAIKGSSEKYLKGDVVILHSGVSRVKDTALSFSMYLKNKGIVNINEIINNLANYNNYTSHYLQYLYDNNNKGELFSNWDKVNSIEEENTRMNNFLNQRNISSEPNIYPSPLKMAIRLGRILATEIDFATITIPDVRTNFVNVTHGPVIMSFLYYFLQDYNPISNDFIKVINGSINYCDGFSIEIYQNTTKSNSVIFKFREYIINIDQKKLKDFCLKEEVY